MIKIQYRFKALEPVHTGGDQLLGIFKPLRRDKVVVPAVSVRSRFVESEDELRRQAVAVLLIHFWYAMPTRSRTTIYDEFSSALLASTSARNKADFVEQMCRRLKIKQLTKQQGWLLSPMILLSVFDDRELLEFIRREHQYIIMLFRMLKDEYQESASMDEAHGQIATIQDEVADVIDRPFEEREIAYVIDYVPNISGNSIRGKLRRVAMYDFMNRIGLSTLSPRMYHRLFTGGVLSASSGDEDLGLREGYIKACPMLGLFGSAIGKQLIDGALKVGMARLCCSENGLGDLSYHDLIDVTFGTRRDSAKSESEIGFDGEADEAPNQMKYEYEVFAQGAEFQHTFACTSGDPLLKSAFFHLLELFVKDPYIVAKGSVGHGHIDLGEIVQMLPDRDGTYLQHLEDNREFAHEFLTSKFP